MPLFLVGYPELNYFYSMNTEIAPLKEGDLIAVVSPAKAIDEALVLNAKKFFEEKGFRVKLGKYCTGSYHYFSGNDAERTEDFQSAIDDPEVKAIVCTRGGYGCVRIVDRLNWAAMLREPKWIIGFSDVTVFHQRMQRYGLKSIHATMPLNFEENTEKALGTLLEAFQGVQPEISIPPSNHNKKGLATGQLSGGNLSILYSLLGTDDQPDYEGTILFVEDLAEQLYHIDRMFFAFRKAGILDKINGLIVGGMTDMKDTAVPFGETLESIILEHFRYRKIPVVFGFPAGHIADNRALVFGTEVELTVTQDEVKLSTFVP